MMHDAEAIQPVRAPLAGRIFGPGTADRIATVLLWAAGFVILAVLAAFLAYILLRGLPVLSLGFITAMPSDIRAGGGVGPQLFNSF